MTKMAVDWITYGVSEGNRYCMGYQDFMFEGVV